jgi:Tol biopolymer transport system component
MEVLGSGLGLAQVSATGGETTLIPLPTPNAALLDLSPNRSELLMASFVGAEGDAPLTTVPLPAGSPRRLGNILAHAGAWAPTGERIVYASAPELYSANRDGSQSRKLITINGVPAWLRWSPDGSLLRFTVGDPKTSSTSLWEATADGTGLRPLLAGWNNPPAECFGNWTADGKYFVFQSTRDGRTDLWVLRERRALSREANRQPWRLTAGPLNFYAPVPSQDGKRLFAVGEQARVELVRYDSQSGHFVPYLSGMSANQLGFGKNGEWIAYLGYPEPTLWRSRADGSQRVQLTFPPMRAFLPHWSPDGKRIAFMGTFPGKPFKIYLISPEGGSPAQAMPGEHNEADPDWSPDGSLLVFGGAPWAEGGRPGSTAIHLLELSSDRVSTLPGSEGLFGPRWSPDGRYICAVPAEQRGIMLFDFRVRKWEQLDKDNAFSFPIWSRDSRYIYFDNVSPRITCPRAIQLSAGWPFTIGKSRGWPA